MDAAFLAEAWPALLRGAGNTILVSLAGIAIGFSLGALIAAAATARSAGARLFARLYVSFFRGVPLLVQLLLSYYALPFLGLHLSPWVAAVGTLGLCCAAYAGEILRGGLSTVPRPALEAALLAGLTPRQTFLRIRLPIALAAMRPALVGEATMILKASALVSVVGISEITRNSQAIAASTFMPLESYALAGLFYLALNLVLLGIGSARRRVP
ncbi:Amino acid ABC transporter permease protein [Roseomonas mucosa]|uniref:Amino acid ABC transporter n=1 Tax=Roseomonas mucosa TaxID=207340 RepID=A0A1S8D3W2_9PROT|nr:MULTISPECIES: amino acid ABC transporter permease [Roseomonas]MBS5901317.1 amino acid ABC transporter permease [Acetobacteraceae bacterium]MDT8265737.1 amino acid ABC transporter permease [Roseomonas sp. DSM 102946]ATR20294.1 amino acid ABC transporter permease [Roseomonas sp. FDAARGOS_362]AWV23022.1 Amino acid ABC transporter permease protein [Roseomonas mucosa]MCG7351378.1 amino acid ABC transporter permease [Roseomonas mucosa]